MDRNGFLIELSESPRTDFGRVDFHLQSDAQKVFTAIWELESQVNNGGFDQYLRYTDSDVIAYAPIALAAIGAHACEAIVAEALGLIAPLPETRAGREESLDRLGEAELRRLEQLDGDFCTYPDDLTELLYAFVAARPATFGSVP